MYAMTPDIFYIFRHMNIKLNRKSLLFLQNLRRKKIDQKMNVFYMIFKCSKMF